MRNLIIVCSVLSLASGCMMPKFKATRSATQSIEFQDLQGIDLKTFNGSVEVSAHSAPTVEMEVNYTGYGMSESEAQANCDALDCVVATDGDQLRLEATRPKGVKASVSFILRVPAEANLSVESSNGRISITGIAAHVEARTSNGMIQCEQVSGSLKASTSNGAIEVADSNCEFDMRTSNGPVRYSGLVYGGNNKIRTSNGGVRVVVPADQLTDIDAETSNGRIDCGIGSTEVRQQSKSSFEATVGQGDSSRERTSISIRTSNGGVKIRPLSTSQADAA